MQRILTLIIGLFFLPKANTQSVGIGTSSPSDALHVVGTANDDPLRVQVGSATKLRVFNNGGTSIGVNNTSGTPANGLYVDGNTGLGYGSPTDRLAVNGDVNIIGEIKTDGISGESGQVLQSNGNGTMQWSTMSTGDESNGNGSWGDCSMNGVEAFQPVNNPSGTTSSQFGNKVKIDGNNAIIGIPFYDGSFSNQGAVMVYTYNEISKTWEQKGNTILDSNPAANENFGFSVDVSGDFIIVGGPNDDSGYTDQGTASIFLFNTTTSLWELQGSKLTNQFPAGNDHFGEAVAIDGNYVIVGAPDDDDAFADQGFVNVFKRNTTSGVWELQGNKITNAGAQLNDHFGAAVDISGNYAIVGCPDDDQGETNEGSVTFLQRNISTSEWNMLGNKLLNSSPQALANFGSAVALDGVYAAVGAPNDDWSNLLDAGSVHIYKRTFLLFEQHSSKLWSKQKYIYDYFGNAVDISSDYLAIGVRGEDDPETNQGSALIFKRYGNLWREIETLKDPSGEQDDQFGFSVSVDGNSKRFIVGAPNHQNDQGIAIFGKIK